MWNKRKWLALVVVFQFLLMSCGASDKQLSQYYQALNKNNEALIKSIEAQAAANSQARTTQFASYTAAMNRAAMTPESTDDVAIALAYGYQAAQPFRVEQPKLQNVKEPETGSEQIRAWTPLITSLIPFVYPFLYNASGGGGTKITADNGSSVALDSGNHGSYNRAGNDQTINATVSDSDVIDNTECADCGEDPLEDVPEDEVCDPENPPGGFNENGTPLQCTGCSCESFANGDCECATLYIP